MICLRDPLLPLVTVSGAQEARVGQSCPHPPPLKVFSCLLSVKLILPGVLPTLWDLISFLGSPYPSLRSPGGCVHVCTYVHGAHILLVMQRESGTYGSN